MINRDTPHPIPTELQLETGIRSKFDDLVDLVADPTALRTLDTKSSLAFNLDELDRLRNVTSYLAGLLGETDETDYDAAHQGFHFAFAVCEQAGMIDFELPLSAYLIDVRLQADPGEIILQDARTYLHDRPGIKHLVESFVVHLPDVEAAKVGMAVSALTFKLAEDSMRDTYRREREVQELNALFEL